MRKKALVTGSAVGIGRAIALHLASKGFDIAVHYNRSEEAAKQVCQQAAAHNVQAIALQADITCPDQAATLVDRAATQLGGLSVIVNNVGNFFAKPMSQVSVAEWHNVLDSNLNSTFYVTQATIPHLKAAGWGRIINFGCASAQHLLARRGNAAYVIAKTGIIVYTKSLAQELIKEHITANVILPGIVENSFDVEEMIPKLPAQRAATLEEINHAVYFFINPDSNYITGQVLEVSGGWNL
ncbi:MAG: bifunctional dihydropteridine reductase/dihydrofolate reductase TmpR [Prochloron sp. SP5CPC1]|nr:bifunctional dihydropteridine reductase/dihydrofolate reductase TmpR [Candidatus Paraprochloron terpiosi SP5CPC1]